MTGMISRRQQHILDVIHASVRERGYPPTIREIAALVGLASPSTVAHHLDVLEERGLIRRDVRGPRALDARPPAPDSARVPVLGAIAAGVPILAEQNVEDELALPVSLVGPGELFALRVRGDSMVEAAICDGDLVVVRREQTADSGDIVAAMIDGEATVKELRTTRGLVELVPRNPAYDVIDGTAATILGKVVTVLRRM
jgi:repressor LexA